MKTFIRHFIILFLGVGLLAPLSWAEEYEIKQMTPEVEAALANRRDRFNALQELKMQGKLGENNRGYVEVLEDSGGASAVAAAENSDRRIIYQTIAEQNNLAHAISTIEQVFANVRRVKAQSGEKIQLEDGSWVTK